MSRVLFVCRHNSARSRMGEVFLRRLAPGSFRTESAGLIPRPPLDLAVEAMAEQGLDITGWPSRNVLDLHQAGERYDWVVIMCDARTAEGVPSLCAPERRLHWDLGQPSDFKGTWEERLAATRQVRDQIEAALEQWLAAREDVGVIPL